ncbi:MBL fold metallo-hydrolase [Catenuloplanes indicus JCM 9534]
MGIVDSAAVTATWWGHATVWLEDSGVRLLTDPLLGDRLAHLRRMRGPRPVLPCPPDAVLVSHLHADHLDIPSLRRIPPDTVFVVPRGATGLIHRRLGGHYSGNCVELAAGEETKIKDVTVRAVPAAHDGGRGPWSRLRGDALGFLIEGSARTWFAGDTGLFDGMSLLGPVDLALVPVGGWGPSLHPAQHLDPAGGAEAVRRAGAAEAIPIHYGTFWPVGMGRVRPHMFHSPGTEFARLTGELLPDVRTHLLAPGESAEIGAS